MEFDIIWYNLRIFWQNFNENLQVFQLIIKSQPVNEDTRKFLQPNRTFEKEVDLRRREKCKKKLQKLEHNAQERSASLSVTYEKKRKKNKEKQ